MTDIFQEPTLVNSRLRRPLLITTALAATLSLAACSGGGGSSASGDSSRKPAATTGANLAPAEDVALGDLVGRGCAPYAKSVPTGAGSLMGMASAPAAVAVSHNPRLATLSSAISGKLNPGVDLQDDLNSTQMTVLAPVNEAFAALPAATLHKLAANDDALTNLLLNHLVVGQMSPTQLLGRQTTIGGDKIAVTGSGNDLKVNGKAVLCGGIKTANATVYLIDGVLSSAPAK